ncbi:MAG: cytochrome c biogenesis protein [Deltaproteobacteria bacterium]|nr:cytochrome c biogenesis protein [Deltaproteobacteria bacterium]
MNGIFFWLPILLYFVGWLVEFVRFWRPGNTTPLWGGGVVAAGWGAHTLFLASHVMDAGLNLATILSGVAWLSIVVYYLVQRRAHNTVFGFIFPPFSIALLIITGVLSHRGDISTQVLGLDPAVALETALVIHIICFLAGNILLAMACLFSILFLYEEHKIKAKMVRLVVKGLPSLGTLDLLIERAVVMGFFFLSLGIILGFALGGVETFPERMLTLRALLPILTWMIYAGFLVERFFAGRRGRYMAIWSIAGFAVVAVSLLVEMRVLYTRA